MMNRPPGISRVSSCRPQDALPKAIADQSERQQRLDRVRRHKWLLAHIRSSRGDFEREIRSRRRLLEKLEPPPAADPLDAAIEEAWQRLYADHARHRRMTPYPVRKGSERRGR
ncbi:hypothetical protein [Rhizobium croatiense]|uniref:hypothetical protein n=1 Tax=Rhizobium croatiense TaxID=2867516 RepID=UPI0023EDB4E8|nr:hypothetical protein [Rhizobium croatiense]WET75514.1 hypothetical protein PYR68_08535 [Rhizobium croatiense]